MGREEQLSKAERRGGDVPAQLAGMFSAVVFTATTWMVILGNNPTATMGWFALHPLLESLAITLITYGIMTLQPTAQPKTKAAGLNRHQNAIAYMAWPSVLLGASAVMYVKWKNDQPHATTWHGTLGYVAVTWVLCQVTFGGAVVDGGPKAKALWKYHRLSGYMLFPLLLLTAHLGGTWSLWSGSYISTGPRLVAYTIAPLIVFGSVYTRVRRSKMKFL